MKNKKILLIIGSIVIAGIAGITLGQRFGWIGGIKPIDVQVMTAKKGKIVELVTASGEIQELIYLVLSLIYQDQKLNF